MGWSALFWLWKDLVVLHSRWVIERSCGSSFKISTAFSKCLAVFDPKIWDIIRKLIRRINQLQYFVYIWVFIYPISRTYEESVKINFCTHTYIYIYLYAHTYIYIRLYVYSFILLFSHSFSFCAHYPNDPNVVDSHRPPVAEPFWNRAFVKAGKFGLVGLVAGADFWKNSWTKKQPITRCWQFKYLLFSSRTLGKMNPFWRAYFSSGLVQPPNRIISKKSHLLICWCSRFLIIEPKGKKMITVGDLLLPF